MDEIECVLPHRPLALKVVDLELQVWRDPQRLDRREVVADDLRGGESVRCIDRPNPRPCANVEYFLYVWGERL